MQKQLSQSDLAETLGVSRQSVSKWETNASVPELDKLVKMAQLFEITMDELVCGETKDAVPCAQTVKSAAEAPRILWRKVFGCALLAFAALLFLLCLLLGGAAAGLICLLVKRNTGLWCGWVVYAMLYAYLRYATGIRFWWAFCGWVYRDGLEIHALIAWGMTLGALALGLVSAKKLFGAKKSA